jgi:hypothetical protein
MLSLCCFNFIKLIIILIFVIDKIKIPCYIISTAKQS